MAVATFTSTKDASAVRQATSNGWSGWDKHHPVGESASGNRFRSFVYFPINFSGMSSIQSATMYMRGHKNTHVLGTNLGPDREVAIHRMVKDWGEGTNRGDSAWSSNETWDYENRAADESNAWTQTGRSLRFFNGYGEGTWYSWDLTEIVTSWFTGQPNYGVILKMHDAEDQSNSDAAVEFYSRDQGSGYRPYIEITYTSNTPPNSPTNLNPKLDALVNTLSPTLTASRSDPDVGDYITAYHAQLFDDSGIADAAHLLWDSGIIEQTGTAITFSKVYSGPALTGNTFYQWRARTRDKGSAWGPWSGLNRFEVNSPPNTPNVNITEIPTNAISTLTPTINVTHSDNDLGDVSMYGYHVILETSAGTPVWDSGDIDTTASPVVTKSIVYSGPSLAWRTGYRVRAKTKDSNGVWGNYSANYSFSTLTALPPDTLSPANDSVISGLVPDFFGRRGSSLYTVSSYQIILYGADGVTQIWDSGTLSTGIAGGETFSKTYTGTALSYNTNYKWKARVTGSIGGTSDYSPLQSFFTPVDATVPTQAVTPVASGRVTSLTPTFGGTRNSAFTAYQIELYPSTSVDGNLGTPIWDSGSLSQASATSFSKVYNGPTALQWNTTYKWRVRVGNPTLGNYTGLASFTTDTASALTLTAPADNAWITTLAPTFTGTSPDSLVGIRFRVWAADGISLVWDSGVLTQTSSTSFSKVYAGPTLSLGTTYLWEAQGTKSTGPTSPWSVRRSFRVNGGPYIPSNLEPTPGYVISGALTPTFAAFFNDPEKESHGDTPSNWIIEIRNNATDAIIHTKTLTTGLNAALNRYVWGTNTGGTDTGLSYNVIYKWRTAFTDSKGQLGTYSSYQTFSSGQPPTIGVTSPSNGSNISTTRPTITWSYSDPASSAMMKYQVTATRVSNGAKVYDSGTKVSSTASFQIPTGYLQVNGESYDISVTAWNSVGLQSNTAITTVQLTLNAPPAISGLSATVEEERSSVVLDWDASALGSAFVTYVIYRKLISDSEWSMVGTRKPESNTQFTDYYAGQRHEYQYRVTVVKLIANEPDVESPDSEIVTAKLQSDVWFVVGRDRADEHIFELPVNDENHTRPVQQESFEPLGTNRKVVVRGFVLGHEGSMQCIWRDEETQQAREQIEYLLYYAGPHILKNPFGDVFDVTFGSPDYQFVGGGMMTVTLTYTEVGATSNPGVSPEEYLQAIGAQ
jgi:hypothetical protein